MTHFVVLQRVHHVKPESCFYLERVLRLPEEINLVGRLNKENGEYPYIRLKPEARAYFKIVIVRKPSAIELP